MRQAKLRQLPEFTTSMEEIRKRLLEYYTTHLGQCISALLVEHDQTKKRGIFLKARYAIFYPHGRSFEWGIKLYFS